MKRITPQELHREWKAGDALILDVRSVSAFAQATEHIPGDVRHNPDELEQWHDQLPHGRHLVAYCT